jgi:hypothetical protein
MRNSDFKALLTTPRTTAGGAQQQQKEGSSFKHPRPKVPADPDRDKKFKKPHPKRPGKPGQPGDKQKEGAEEPLYRWGCCCLCLRIPVLQTAMPTAQTGYSV